MTSVAFKTRLGNCSPYIKRHFCIDPMTILVSHQAAPHILQQNCTHAVAYWDYTIDRIGVMTKKAEKMLPKLLNEWLCNVQHCPRVWILELSRKALQISLSASGVKRNFWPLRNFWPILVCQWFYFQSKGIKFGDYFLDVCGASQNFFARCQIPTTSYSTGINITAEKLLDLVLDVHFF